MSDSDRSIHRIRLLGASLIGVMLAVVACTSSVMGQVPPTHGTPLPGTVGPWRPPTPVSPRLQAVEFRGPEGLIIAPAMDGSFGEATVVPMLAGMLVHPVYRFRISGILDAEDRAVYPTVELLDCLSPPPGQELRFPIPIEFTAEDLRLALAGNFVTRVIYVEDPHTAIPVASEPKHENWYDAGPGVDPVMEARTHGRPIAIVRMGGIEPDPEQGPDPQFLNGCPPLVVLPRPPKIVYTTDAPAAKPPTTGPSTASPPKTDAPAEPLPVPQAADGANQLPAEKAAP